MVRLYNDDSMNKFSLMIYKNPLTSLPSNFLINYGTEIGDVDRYLIGRIESKLYITITNNAEDKISNFIKWCINDIIALNEDYIHMDESILENCIYDVFSSDVAPFWDIVMNNGTINEDHYTYFTFGYTISHHDFLPTVKDEYHYITISRFMELVIASLLNIVYLRGGFDIYDVE